MGIYRLSREAEFDLEDIYYTGVVDFGLAQADLYYNGLKRFQNIADAPLLYPEVSHIRDGYRQCLQSAFDLLSGLSGSPIYCTYHSKAGYSYLIESVA